MNNYLATAHMHLILTTVLMKRIGNYLSDNVYVYINQQNDHLFKCSKIDNFIFTK